ncbi:tyrosine-type recombinase/integrase [Priestia megaterium]|uniref:tyrosine-type recombinase/integrase n=1 Tax=Priestia megaterium TaxID=1404 RepID=UPI0030C96970
MKNDAFEKLKRAFSKNANYKTSTGYTGNSKTSKEYKELKKEKKTYTAKQRRLDDLSDEEKNTYWLLQNQVSQMFVKHSNVSRRVNEDEEIYEDKVTKDDVKKGLAAEGIWSSTTYDDYLKKSKTFLKYCVVEKDVKNLKDIKPGMLADYIRYHIDKGSSAKTISSYVSAVKKMGEIGAKEGVKRMKKLGASQSVRDLVPEYDQQAYRRGKFNGYSIEDTQVLAKKADEHFSPLHRAAVEVLGYSGTRLDEFRKVKWRHLDFDNNRIYLTDRGMTKGSRPRFVPVPPKTMDLLKTIRDAGLHSDDNERIWGSKMSEDNVRDFIQECARLGKKKYSGVHDFRRSALRYSQRELEKVFKQGLMNKEDLVDRIMNHVAADKSLNPLIKKYPPKTDRKGRIKWFKNKNGGWYTKPDKSKPAVLSHKYEKEELMGRRIDYLKNLYLSQVLGHNRTDITAIYKEKEMKVKKK